MQQNTAEYKYQSIISMQQNTNMCSENQILQNYQLLITTKEPYNSLSV
jgi:hypothetical protein